MEDARNEPHGAKRRLHCLQWSIRNGGRAAQPATMMTGEIVLFRYRAAPQKVSEICIQTSDGRLVPSHR